MRSTTSANSSSLYGRISVGGSGRVGSRAGATGLSARRCSATHQAKKLDTEAR